jgi:hypothetical protein
MQKGFSLLNIIILFSIISLGFLWYQNSFNGFSKNINSDKTEVSIENLKDTKVKDDFSILDNSEIKDEKKASALPDPDTLPTSPKLIEKTIIEVQEENNPGYFLNEEYNYKIYFPKDWQIRKNYLQEIIIGNIPPRDGIGSLKIKIGDDTELEIKNLKQEAKKHSGMISIREEQVLIDNIYATKIILTNIINQIKTSYIIFENNNINYIISYVHESEKFIQEVNKILNKFEFI